MTTGQVGGHWSSTGYLLLADRLVVAIVALEALAHVRVRFGLQLRLELLERARLLVRLIDLQFVFGKEQQVLEPIVLLDRAQVCAQILLVVDGRRLHAELDLEENKTTRTFSFSFQAVKRALPCPASYLIADYSLRVDPATAAIANPATSTMMDGAG